MKLSRTLILSVFVVASCGLAYELIMAALASYLLGDSIFQYSFIIGLYLFSMGIGAHLTRYIKDEDALTRFIEIELLVGLLGGLSALFLFTAFGFAAAPFRTLLYALVLLVGTIVGMEIPLVMRVLNQQEADFKEIVSRVLTFDYMGALAVSLLFPLILAPKLGMARSALLFGLLNAAVAVLTAKAFRAQLPNYA
ncbi:polyamine aminopropyltransferase, partial [Kingella kingae]|nr:polyamine aminopropyltransferase [Kingella kingae]